MTPEAKANMKPVIRFDGDPNSAMNKPPSPVDRPLIRDNNKAVLLFSSEKNFVSKSIIFLLFFCTFLLSGVVHNEVLPQTGSELLNTANTSPTTEANTMEFWYTGVDSKILRIFGIIRRFSFRCDELTEQV